jgi:methionyl-tRNA synthetase
MPDKQKTYYLTTPIYYVNARPHIGHAYTTIVADVLARRHRLLGEDTFFLTGTDEHGQKIERSAAAAGIPPQQFADEVSKTFEDLWKRMGITNNAYIRTTDAAHAKGVQKLFSTLYEKGYIYLASYTGSYCVSDEAFVDAPVGTPCPDCCRLLEEVTEENFFFKLSEFQAALIDLISQGPDGEDPKLKILPDSARNEVLAFLQGNAANLDRQSKQKDNPELQRIATLAIKTFLETGTLKRSLNGLLFDAGRLKDLSISRSSFTWGIPVPEEIQRKENTKHPHVIYVWLDALANYITALGYGSDDTTLLDKFWPADLHLVGKEIIRFHCVYWPAFLLAADIALPKQITAHGWLLFDNSKMSKSKGNIVRTETILDGFGTLCPPTFTGDGLSEASVTGGGSGLQPTESTPPEKGALAPGFSAPTKAERDLFASDILRYHLLREIPFGQDGGFSFDAMITRYNADLAHGYGNLSSRTLKAISSLSDPTPHFYPSDWNETLEEGFRRDRAARSRALAEDSTDKLDHSSPKYVRQQTARLAERSLFHFDLNNFNLAIQLALELITHVDGFLTRLQPWKLCKSSIPTDQRIGLEAFYTAAESIRIITALLHPILPYATAKVWAQLGLGDIEAAASNGELKNLEWGGLKPGTKLGPLSPIFPRADKGLIDIMTELENPTPEPISTFDPAAAPRTGAPDAAPLTVAGSHATTTGPDNMPSHTEAQASGIFAHETPKAAGPADASPQIAIDDFVKIELRVAEILLAKADKLLRLEVDLGYEKRQILSGIAEFYTPEELVGRRIIVITNLAPRKMRGLESHGMLLAASEEGGKPFLATVPEGVPVGTRLK